MTIKYLWHIHGERWERVFEKINVPISFKSIHEKYLGKNNSVERKKRILPFCKKNDKLD